jgi:hypothetical protein
MTSSRGRFEVISWGYDVTMKGEDTMNAQWPINIVIMPIQGIGMAFHLPHSFVLSFLNG